MHGVHGAQEGAAVDLVHVEPPAGSVVLTRTGFSKRKRAKCIQSGPHTYAGLAESNELYRK